MSKKRKKVVKMRGSKTHGYGSKKKHRGAGHRGGRGRAGSFKHKKLMLIKRGELVRKKGFKSLEQKGIKKGLTSINLRDLIKLVGDSKEIDVSSLGYDKVLGKGNIDKPLTVKAKFFSAKAVEKIEKAGGKAITLGG